MEWIAAVEKSKWCLYNLTLFCGMQTNDLFKYLHRSHIPIRVRCWNGASLNPRAIFNIFEPLRNIDRQIYHFDFTGNSFHRHENKVIQSSSNNVKFTLWTHARTHALQQWEEEPNKSAPWIPNVTAHVFRVRPNDKLFWIYFNAQFDFRISKYQNLHSLCEVHFVRWEMISAHSMALELELELGENMIGCKSFAIISFCSAINAITMWKHWKIYSDFVGPSYAFNTKCQSAIVVINGWMCNQM